ncbi:hypothetical protein D9Q98_001336 [Chlorella vulgaris]|uniref:Ubiquinol oxidase n=1 Tax=Chlorella vulgaris TaxID=3077 RepID=A0A9D4Z320_CHLVU|nr:hypothetical protein D9Q98_001336 [Chlorella vulgaris]
MVSTKTTSSLQSGPAGQVPGPRTYGAGYIAPHVSLRKDAIDVETFLSEHQVYTPAYLESVQALHRVPKKAHEYIAWYLHVMARTIIGLLTGTWGMGSGVSERAMGRRILMFTSVGTAGALAGVVANHIRCILWNVNDNGWVRTAAANAECVRMHSGIMAGITWRPRRPPLLARLFHIALQVTTFFQLLVLSFLLPSVALAYDAYRAEEQVFNYSQAIDLIDSGRFSHWRSMQPSALASSYYGLQDGCSLRNVLLRMRADEASMHYIQSVLADLPVLSTNPFIIMESKNK